MPSSRSLRRRVRRRDAPRRAHASTPMRLFYARREPLSRRSSVISHAVCRRVTVMSLCLPRNGQAYRKVAGIVVAAAPPGRIQPCAASAAFRAPACAARHTRSRAAAAPRSYTPVRRLLPPPCCASETPALLVAARTAKVAGGACLKRLSMLAEHALAPSCLYQRGI
jgi:hypothetical protein